MIPSPIGKCFKLRFTPRASLGRKDKCVVVFFLIVIAILCFFELCVFSKSPICHTERGLDLSESSVSRVANGAFVHLLQVFVRFKLCSCLEIRSTRFAWSEWQRILILLFLSYRARTWLVRVECISCRERRYSLFAQVLQITPSLVCSFSPQNIWCSAGTQY